MTTNVTYENLLNFNNVESSKAGFALIPDGTIAKAHLTIRAGGAELDAYLTKSSNTGAVYLNAEFVILEGSFAKRKIFQNIGVVGAFREGDNDVFGTRGRSFLRSLIESAKNIYPTDNSEEAQKARKISGFAELDGLVCIIKIGVDKDKSGKYADRNCVLCAITTDKKEYEQVMHGVQDDKNVWY